MGMIKEGGLAKMGEKDFSSHYYIPLDYFSGKNIKQ